MYNTRNQERAHGTGTRKPQEETGGWGGGRRWGGGWPRGGGPPPRLASHPNTRSQSVSKRASSPLRAHVHTSKLIYTRSRHGGRGARAPAGASPSVQNVKVPSRGRFVSRARAQVPSALIPHVPCCEASQSQTDVQKGCVTHALVRFKCWILNSILVGIIDKTGLAAAARSRGEGSSRRITQRGTQRRK